jgi:hypothetical protein
MCENGTFWLEIQGNIDLDSQNRCCFLLSAQESKWEKEVSA